jgi:ATP-dependent DNA helicase RecG
MTIEDMLGGISRIRNRVISRVFNELHLVEQWGSGVQRMIKACVEMGLPEPKFEEISKRFRVTIYLTPVLQVILGNIENQIMELLTQYRYLSTAEIAGHLKRSTRAIRVNLINLIAMIAEIAKSPTDPKKKYTIL